MAPNVALVVLDTLRKDRFESDFDWLTDRGVYFDDAWSTAHWTVSAHASLFTGRYPREVGTHAKNRFLDRADSTLAKLLSEAGYRTRGITANGTIFPRFEFDRGFGEYRKVNEFEWAFHLDSDATGIRKYTDFVANVVTGEDPTLSTLKDAFAFKFLRPTHEDDGASRVLELVQDATVGDREFLFVNLMEAHSPYAPPPDYRTGDAASVNSLKATALDDRDHDDGTIRGAYDDASRYLSDIYGDIHAELVEKFDLVVTLSDHGEGLGEDGVWGHPAVLSPPVTRVPLSMTGRLADEMAATDEPVNLLDVFRTVCDVAGVEPPADARGRSLRDQPEEDVYRFVESRGLTRQELDFMDELGVDASVTDRFDRPRRAVAGATGYAFETIDGRLEVRGEIDDPEERIAEFDRRVPTAETSADQAELPDQVKRQLEHLGYA